MATRIEIELTSRQDDGTTFTWRAAGARQPKGVADASLFPEGSQVGEQFRVDADMDLEGITITNVLPPKEAKPKPETLQLLARDDEPLVTQQLATKGGRDRGDRKGGRGKRRDGDERPRGKGRGDDRGGEGRGGEGRGDRGRGEGREGGGRGRGPDRPRTPAKPKLPPKPKPPRLKAGKTHRNALIDSLPEEQKPVAQELLRGGLQGVRQALAKQNDQLETEGKPKIDERPMLTLAEELLAKVRVAEWQDRAEAALEQAAEVDLRDLRSVVTAADGTAKDDETRALAAKLRTALSDRLEAEHNAWIAEIIEMLDDDRAVRALHLSSRPPKAGAMLPAPVAMRLVEAANASMTSETSTDRWGYILEALAHSPVRRQVVPESLPTTVSPELKAVIARHATRLPEIAEIFGIEPDPAAARAGNRRPRRGGKGKAKSSDDKGAKSEGAKPKDAKSDGDAAKSEADAAKADDAKSEDVKPEGDAAKADDGGTEDGATTAQADGGDDSALDDDAPKTADAPDLTPPAPSPAEESEQSEPAAEPDSEA